MKYAMLPKLVLLFAAVITTAGCLSGGGGSDTGSTAPSSPSSSATTATRTVGPDTYTWTVTCGGGSCQQGKFIGGDIWIAPKSAGETIILVSVTTTGTSAGLVTNPTTTNTQGLLPGGFNYDATLNLSGSLPLTVATNTSIVKATSRTSSCQPSGATLCISTEDVLTVLPSPPLGGTGANVFRPGMAGATKTLYSLADFDLTKLPSDARVNTAAGGAINFAAINVQWTAPFVDHYIATFGDSGRAFVPSLIPNYGADMGAAYLQGTISVMGTDLVSNKTPALVGLVQRGIDLYASYKAGVTWPTGAGQQLGRKPPIAFFASLLINPAIKTEVAAITAANANTFQEDGQIQVVAATGNIPVWGDQGGSCNENFYWNGVMQGQCFAGASGMAGFISCDHGRDNIRTCRDPYGWIDGPGGLPGHEYMVANSGGNYYSYQVAMSLMPELCATENNRKLSVLTKRYVATGAHTLPDNCAPPDPLENLITCTPFNGGATCLRYKVTWGPDPASPGNCIPNNTGGNVGQTGRFPAFDGTIGGTPPGANGFLNTPTNSILDFAPIAKQLLLTTPAILSVCTP